MKDLYNEIANRIIEQLESGVIPWRKPWSGRPDGAISHATGRPYSLINQMLLDRPGEYLTFNQVKTEGGKVKKGAKARFVVFWKVYPKQQKNDDGTPATNDAGEPVYINLPILRYFQVFHIDDTEGIAPKWDRNDGPAADPDERADAVLLDYVRREGIRLEQLISDEAYYSPSRDLIHLPIREQFDRTAEYYGTAFHEATHSTGHVTRLNRFSGADAVAAFGSESYSKEELVAEIGSASILHTLNLETPQSFKNSAAYIQSWLQALKNDKRMIISAAARAEKAVKLILNIQDEHPAEA
jgi:antirestriction protein ArdC